jgi:hypothetical protein
MAARKAPSKGSSVRVFIALCLASIGVMVPWPLLGMLITRSHCEGWGESVLLFGGITGVPLAILALAGLPEPAFMALILLVWLAAAIIPDLWLVRRLHAKHAVIILLGAQGLFAFAQAVMGALMIFGKAV